MVPLTGYMIKDFATILGEEALAYFRYLKRIRPVDDEVFETYKGFYAKFQTIPMLFLSVVPDKGVYLWQVNRFCPYKKGSNHMILDSKAMKADVKAQISILMLAKIAPEKGEEIVDALFTGEGHVCTKSTTSEQHLVIRSYRIKDFIEIARVNPFIQDMSANDKHYCKLVVKRIESTERYLGSQDITLWRNKTTEELEKEKEEKNGSLPIVKEKFVQRIKCLGCNMMSRDSLMIGTQNGITIFFDYGTSTMLAWNENVLFTLNYSKTGDIRNVATKANNIYVKSGKWGLNYVIQFDTFPNVEFKTDSRVLSDEIIYKTNKSITFLSDSNDSDPRYEDKENLVYDVPISVINPYFEEVETEKQEKGKEKVKNSRNMNEIKNKINYKTKKQADFESDLKDTKKILKDIRASISSKIGEIMKFNDEYQQKEKKGQTKTVKGPESVSKEAIELYKEVKTEKKMIEREREKGKAQRKKNRYNDYND